jgi:hypothetical protein
LFWLATGLLPAIISLLARRWLAAASAITVWQMKRQGRPVGSRGSLNHAAPAVSIVIARGMAPIDLGSSSDFAGRRPS